jgi:acetoacetate decarboxylase
VAQLVGYNLEDIYVHGAWDGEARLHFIPHINCRVADLPVKRVIGGRHMIVDFACCLMDGCCTTTSVDD